MRKILREIKDIFNYWELLITLASKQIRIAYKHTIIGVAWSIVVSVFTMVILKIVFSTIIKIGTTPYPYFIFSLTGIIPFSYLRSCINSSSMVLINNSSLLKRVYFPREIIPISLVVSELYFFLVNIFVVTIVIAFQRFHFSLLFLLLPLVILMQVLFIIGVSLMVSSLQVMYRDVKYIVEIILVAWFYLTPVFYPLDLVSRVSGKFLWFYMLNPMTHLITLYRVILLPGYQKTLPASINIGYLIAYSLIASVLMCVFGFYIFMKNEKKFVDYL